MSISRITYKNVAEEFKVEAVRLMCESNRPAAESATGVGIRRNMLYKWKEQLGSKGDEAFLKQAG